MPSPAPRSDSDETARLLERAAGGDSAAAAELLARDREALRRFLHVHLDPALRPRLDPSDLVQEAQLELARRLPEYLTRRPMPFHLWVWKTAYERLLNARRDHRAHCRDVGREEAARDASSVALADRFVARGPSPAEAVEARERAGQVAAVVAGLSADDREILLLRLEDGLPYEEIACLLDIAPDAARQRYGRALVRFERALSAAGLSQGAS